jgi:hypothetical protein
VTPDREREIERICNTALECPPAERDRFLADACGDDQSLRVQVDRLLAQEPRAASFLETPAILVAGREIGGSLDGGDDTDAATTLSPRASADAPSDTPKGFAQHGPLDDARFAPGEIFASRHRIVSLLGRGAMGEVYRADDLKLGQPVALKLLASTAEDGGGRRQRFITEVRHARTIGHPNVCRVYDIGEADGWSYISMELVDGETLESLLRRIGPLPAEKTLDIARQLCAGLAAAHDRGVLHRDLKPSNIMVDGRGQIRILDFGLAVTRSDWTIGEIAGTPAYMAPEQAVGNRATEQTDLYALGLILYELYAGRPLFPMSSGGRRHRDDTPAVPSVPGMDPAIERIIHACLERDPIKRPASALAIAALLPGGDSLAAAMAKGVVLSPEMVAATGPSGTLLPWQAWALLGAILIGALAIADQAHVMNVSPSDVPKPPEALAERARNILSRSGVTATEMDSASWFAIERLLPASSRALPATAVAAADARPTDITFVYRQSPQRLVPRNASRLVTDTDPPADIPGMATVTVDALGRLVRFTSVGQASAAAQPKALAPEWTPLFVEAGLDERRFAATEPAHAPLVPYDTRFAWQITSDAPGPHLVTAAALDGVIVQFDAGSDRVPPDVLRGALSMGRSVAAEAASWLAVIVIFVGGAVLARRNLRLGHGDRRGAARLSIVVVCFELIGAVLRAHHVPLAIAEVTFLYAATGAALVGAGLTWLMYVSLEPYLRREWPTMLIAWSRLLSGRVRDPLIGRHVLIGMLAGLVIVAISIARIQVVNDGAPIDTLTNAIESLDSVPHFANIVLTVQMFKAFYFALAWPFLLLLLRLIVRKMWIAAPLWILIGIPFGLGGAAISGWALVHVIAAAVMAITVLRRVGLVALFAMVFTGVLMQVPMTLDTDAWYFGRSLVVLLVLAALAIYGFMVSLGSRSAFGASTAQL